MKFHVVKTYKGNNLSNTGNSMSEVGTRTSHCGAELLQNLSTQRYSSKLQCNKTKISWLESNIFCQVIETCLFFVWIRLSTLPVIWIGEFGTLSTVFIKARMGFLRILIVECRNNFERAQKEKLSDLMQLVHGYPYVINEKWLYGETLERKLLQYNL